MSGAGVRRCGYCGGVADGERKIHDWCREDALYARNLARYRAMPELPTLSKLTGGSGYARRARAVRRVSLERYLDVLMASART